MEDAWVGLIAIAVGRAGGKGIWGVGRGWVGKQEGVGRISIHQPACDMGRRNE